MRCYGVLVARVGAVGRVVEGVRQGRGLSEQPIVSNDVPTWFLKGVEDKTVAK